jgi:hypothetical protein
VKVLLVYITVTNGSRTNEFAARFIGTYFANQPQADHETLVVCNGGPPSTELGIIMEPLDPKYFVRQNDPGWDISGYQAAAHGPAAAADIFVAIGESVHFHRPGWLRRIVDTWGRFGAGMYGFYSSNIVRPHMNTTAFATHPSLLREYPHAVTTHGDRYLFEHGPFSFWRYVRSRGMPTKLVTFDGEWDPFLWRYPPDILFRGSQTNCLAWCNHTQRWFETTPQNQAAWAAHADSQPQEALR